MKKKVVKILAGGVLALVVICVLGIIFVRPAADHPFFDQEGVLVMAHRGGRGLWPENTLYAFEQAVALGVDVLEMDLHSTADGVLVLIHDKTVERTTGGNGPVSGYTWKQLQALDAGYYWSADEGQTYPYRGLGIGVPALAEVFAAFPHVPMNIEIKQSQPDITLPFCRLIRENGMSARVLVASFDEDTIRAFRRVCPEVATTSGENEVRVLYGLSLGYLGGLYWPPAEALQVPEYSGNIHVVTPRFIQAAHRRNMEVYVWTVNDPADMQRMLDLGVDGLITDHPDQLLALMGR